MASWGCGGTSQKCVTLELGLEAEFQQAKSKGANKYHGACSQSMGYVEKWGLVRLSG